MSFQGNMDEYEIRAKMYELQQEHRDLDDAIIAVDRLSTFDQLQVQRLKKRKLIIKDQLSRMHDMLIPDIIA